MTTDQAKVIYKKEYWDPSGAGTIISNQLALMHFDSAVNPGLGAALHFLKDSCGNPERYLVERIKYYHERVRERPVKAKYFYGWITRALDAYNKES
jgi:hypothetical protein